jgi:hypothetical protein
MTGQEERISEKAYYKCKRNPKSLEHKNITHPQWALLYCRFIKDDPKVRKYITTKETAQEYCSKVKNDRKVKKYI